RRRSRRSPRSCARPRKVPEVVIAGAGIAGLACARKRLGLGFDDFVVLEAAERAGGPAETVRVGEYLVARGPLTGRANAGLYGVIGAAGLARLPARRAAPGFVSDGAIVTLPPSLGALLSGAVLPLGTLASVLAEPLRPVRAGPRSVRGWVEERLGADAAERL